MGEATNDRQAAVRAADLGARLPRTAGTAGLTVTTIRPVATAEAKRCHVVWSSGVAEALDWKNWPPPAMAEWDCYLNCTAPAPRRVP